MAKRFNHRKPRYLRAAAILAWALQGLFAPWMQTPVYADSSDTLMVGVQPISLSPPTAIPDLLASANPSIAGQVSLSWTAPQAYSNMSGVAVASYSVHFATYSIDSLSGNTTSWWNNTMVSSVTLQSPAHTPQSPGSLEAYTLNGLQQGTTYFFAMRSINPQGILSAIDTEASTPTQQAYAVTSTNLVPPSSFTGLALTPQSIRWTWNTVPSATAYEVFSDPAATLLQTITAPTTFWTETALTVNTAYTRKVRATDGTLTTGYSPTATVYTQANVPSTLAINSITTQSIALSWNANGNPAGTSFGLEHSLDGVAFVSISTTTSTSFNDTGLTLNTTYYYRLRAINGDGVLTAYTPVVSAATAVSSISPTAPNGLLATSLANGLQMTLTWTPVTKDTSGNPITVDHYLVYRYLTIGDTPTVVGTLSSPTHTYAGSTGGSTLFYRVQAVSNFGSTSALSDYTDSAGNRYALAPDDSATRVVMPREAARYLLAANNGYGEDLDIAILHQPQDEVNVTLRSYKISAFKVASGDLVSGFMFPQNIISIQLGYGSALSSSPGASALPARTGGAGSIAQIVSVYWYNGTNFVSVGEPTLTSGQSIAVTVRNLGIYQIRAVTLGVKFRLAPGSPYPRVITPQGSENRRVFWFFDNPASDTVTGTIYDIRGAHVRDLHVNGMSPTPNSLVWDGRDDQGATVPSGVYLYKISTADQTVTGTVVVAR